MTIEAEEVLELALLPHDLRKAAATLGAREARYLVDSYYQLQEFRKASANQTRALNESEEPHTTVMFFTAQFHTLENQIKGALDTYSAAQPLGEWARSVKGIGPVITAGLLAHIDITKAPTVGHIWSFAGLNPTMVWEKGQKRPFNASLKVLCWKIGDSFVKVSGKPDAFYGTLYRERKAFEVARDEAGGHAQAAKETLEKRNIKDAQLRKTYESGHLPAGRLDLRARRYAVKIFLAHYHEVAYKLHYKTEPPLPYSISHLGHAHKIEVPGF